MMSDPRLSSASIPKSPSPRSSSSDDHHEGFADDGQSHERNEPEQHPIQNTGYDAGQMAGTAPQTPENRHHILLPSLGVLITSLLTVLIAVLVIIYKEKGSMSGNQKHVFEFLNTGLILFLGLNFVEAFKALAESARDVIRGRSQWARGQDDLINEISSFKKVTKLAFSRVPLAARMAALAWVLLGITAQVFVAIISLTFSTQDGTNYNGTYTTPGNVSAANLTCYFAFYNSVEGCGGDEPDVIGQGLAHTYGDLAVATPCCKYTDISEVLDSKLDCPYYCNHTPDQQEFAYRFNEYNPNDTQKSYPYFTNRTITASSGPCLKYSQGKVTELDNGNSLYEYYNSTYKSTIQISDELTAVNGTTYIYRGFHPPQEAILQLCGLRCMTMWAHRSRGVGEPPLFFECPISISTVSNVGNPAHNISDGLARVAAASIALQGRPGVIGNWTQFQLYTFGSIWETHFTTSDKVGANMAEFALGSLAFMAHTNPQLRIEGTMPHLGTTLSVHWGYLIALLVGITGTHLGLWFLTIRLRKRSGESVGGRIGGGGGGGGSGGRGAGGGYVNIELTNSGVEHGSGGRWRA